MTSLSPEPPDRCCPVASPPYFLRGNGTTVCVLCVEIAALKAGVDPLRKSPALGLHDEGRCLACRLRDQDLMASLSGEGQLPVDPA